jgi:GNAT superfamily N-acetyltransferase
MYHIQMIDKPSHIESLHEAITHWAGWIETTQRRWWVAIPPGEGPTGWCGFAGVQLDFERKHVVMTPCEVKIDWRGHGIQKAFLRVREKWAVEHGFKESFSMTLAENLVSANNLIKCGYTLIPSPVWTNGKGLYFRKQLDATDKPSSM